MESRIASIYPKLLLSTEEQKELLTIYKHLHEPQRNLQQLQTALSELSKYIALINSRMNNQHAITVDDTQILLFNYLLSNDKQYTHLMAILAKLTYLYLSGSETDSEISEDETSANHAKINSLIESLVDAYHAFKESKLQPRTMPDMHQLKALQVIAYETNNHDINTLMSQIKHLQLQDILNGLTSQKNYRSIQALLADLDTVLELIEYPGNISLDGNISANKSATLLLNYLQLNTQERDQLIGSLMLFAQGKADIIKVSETYEAFKSKKPSTERQDILTILSLESEKQAQLLEIISNCNNSDIIAIREAMIRHQLLSAIEELRSSASLRTIKEQLNKSASLLSLIESRLSGKEIVHDNKSNHGLLMKFISLSTEEKNELFASMHKLCCITDYTKRDAYDAAVEQLQIFKNLSGRQLPTHKQKEQLLLPYYTLPENNYLSFQKILYKLCRSKNIKQIKEHIKSCAALVERCKDKEQLQSISRHYLSTQSMVEFINNLITYTRQHPITIKISIEERTKDINLLFDELSTLYKETCNKINGSSFKGASFFNLHTAVTTVSTPEIETGLDGQITFFSKVNKLDATSEKMLLWRISTTNELLADGALLSLYENHACSLDEKDVSDHLASATDKLKRIKSETDIRAFVANLTEWRLMNSKALSSLEATLPLLNSIEKLLIIAEKVSDKNQQSTHPSDIQEQYAILITHYTRLRPYLPTSNHHISQLAAIFSLPTQTKRRLQTIQLEKSVAPSAQLATVSTPLLNKRTSSRTLALPKAGDVESFTDILPQKAKPTVPNLNIGKISPPDSGRSSSPIKRRYEHMRPTQEQRREEMAKYRGLSLAKLNNLFNPPTNPSFKEEKTFVATAPQLIIEDSSEESSEPQKTPTTTPRSGRK